MKKQLIFGAAILAVFTLILVGCARSQTGEAYRTTGPVEAGKTKVTYQGVLDMLQDNCNLYLNRFNNTCKDECESVGKTCIMALTVVWQSANHTVPEHLYEQLDTCTRIKMSPDMKRMDCICCSPPK